MYSLTSSSAIQCDASGALRSARYGDVYFNSQHGADESRHVYLAGNRLEQRWRESIQANDSAPFVIGELGFGSGLNFLVTLQCWQRLRPAGGATLYYYATEAHPLTRKALRKALAHCNPCPDLAAQLLQQYPDPVGNTYTLSFDAGGARAYLVLLLGNSIDALDWLEHYPPPRSVKPGAGAECVAQSIDAWYLDGFSPAKNPQMWQRALFSKLARHSHAGTSFATFSAARQVRDNLVACGFEVQRATGFGPKREMLCGNFRAPLTDTTASTEASKQARLSPAKVPANNSSNRQRGDSYHRAFFRVSQPRQHAAGQQSAQQGHALVIGAGIAGCCTAAALAGRGWQVSVVDRAKPGSGQGASANDAALLYARTAAQASPLSNWHEAAFHHAVNFYRKLGCGDSLRGMLKLGEQLSSIWNQDHPECEGRCNVDALEASKIAATEVADHGIFYSQSGWLSPRDVCQRLLGHTLIEKTFGVAALNLQRRQEGWLVDFNDGSARRFDAVVIACAQASKQFAQTAWLPLKALRGQTSSIPSCEHSAPLRVPLCGKGYLVPAVRGRHECGASYSAYEHESAGPGTLPLMRSEHLENLAKAQSLIPNMTVSNTGTAMGRASLRCVTPDYLPLAGSLVDATEFRNDFAELSRNARRVPSALAKPLPGLLVNCGYGSHGFTSAPLLAELLVAELCGSPVPLADSLRRAVHPSRFLVREIVRGKSPAYMDT